MRTDPLRTPPYCFRLRRYGRRILWSIFFWSKIVSTEKKFEPKFFDRKKIWPKKVSVENFLMEKFAVCHAVSPKAKAKAGGGSRGGIPPPSVRPINCTVLQIAKAHYAAKLRYHTTEAWYPPAKLQTNERMNERTNPRANEKTNECANGRTPDRPWGVCSKGQYILIP